jgi:hypothetical protein
VAAGRCRQLTESFRGPKHPQADREEVRSLGQIALVRRRVARLGGVANAAKGTNEAEKTSPRYLSVASGADSVMSAFAA